MTGNSWTFPIERADTIIRLPDGAEVLQHAAYTGPFGAQGRDVAVIAAKGSLYRAETTRRLEAGEGFTVAVGFTKGIVTPPAPPPDYTVTSYYVLGGGVLFMALYYMLTWLRVGRDPSGGPVIPRWHPPEGLEPAGVRYIWTRAYDEKSFAAALIGLAAKGLLRITHGEHYEIARTGGDKSGLTLTEKKLLSYVPKTLQVKRGNAGALDLMWSTLRHHTTTDFDRPTVLRNRKWFWLGILLSFLVLVASLIFVRPEEFTVALIVVYICGAIWALALWLLFMGFRMFRTSWFLALLLLAICVPLMALGLLFPPALVMGFSGPTLWIYMAALAALAAMHILFARLLSAPTVLGAKLKAEVEGLRLYMTTAEEHRLNLLNPPDKTPELFERLLPYALALDCENRWSDKFASVLEAARYTGPTWYQGASLLSDMSDFSRTLDDNRHAPSPGGSSGSSSSFSTSSSSWSPGSSSGSSGADHPAVAAVAAAAAAGSSGGSVQRDRGGLRRKARSGRGIAGFDGCEGPEVVEARSFGGNALVEAVEPVALDGHDAVLNHQPLRRAPAQGVRQHGFGARTLGRGHVQPVVHAEAHAASLAFDLEQHLREGVRRLAAFIGEIVDGGGAALMRHQNGGDVLAGDALLDAGSPAIKLAHFAQEGARHIQHMDADVHEDEALRIGKIRLAGIDVEIGAPGEAAPEGRADFARGHDFAGAQYGALETEILVHHDRQILAVRRRDEAQRILPVERQRLLHDHAHAMGRAEFDQRPVRGRRRDNVGEIGLRLAQHGSDVCIARRNAETLGCGLGLGGIEIAYRDEVAASFSSSQPLMWFDEKNPHPITAARRFAINPLLKLSMAG